MGLLLSKVSELVARGTGKPEVLVPPVPQSSLMRPHRYLCLMQGFKKDKESKSGDKDQVRDYLRELDPCKSMGQNGLHPRLLRELICAHTRLLSVIFEWSWRLGKSPDGWRKANVVPIFSKV